jgi:signal transduction histidine kinase
VRLYLVGGVNYSGTFRWPKSALAKYVTAGILLFTAFGVRLYFERWLEGRAAYLPFVAVVVAVAAWFGRGPALAALFAGVCLGQLFVPPQFSALPQTPADWWYAVAYLAFGGMVIALVHLLHRAREEAHGRATAEAELRRRDHTEAVRIQESLKSQAQRSESALVERTGQLEAFTYTVAHDLRAPLRAMQGFAQILRDEHAAGLDPEGREFIQRIVDSAARMNALVSDLLEFGNLDRNEPELRDLALAVVIERVAAKFSRRMQDAGAELEVIGPIPRVHADEGLLRRCLEELLDNALAFRAPDRKLRIRTWAEDNGGAVRWHVADNGKGIPKEFHERIFRVFERLDESAARSGVGLAIVRKATELMGGRVGVESQVDAGSDFWMELPKAQQQAPRSKSQSQ